MRKVKFVSECNAIYADETCKIETATEHAEYMQLRGNWVWKSEQQRQKKYTTQNQ